MSGAFKEASYGARQANVKWGEDTAGARGMNGWSFSASKSNSTYADGAALRPQAISILALIKI